MAAPQKGSTESMEHVPVASADVSGADALPYYIAALLPSGTPRWNDQSSIGNPATVTFSFMTESPAYAWFDDSFGFAQMSGVQQAAVRAALATWSEVANITFKEVADTGDGGEIRFGTNNQNGASGGYTYFPSSDPAGGDIYIANDQASNTNPEPGNWGYHTLVHEIGHAIGLKHPGDYDAHGGGAEGPFLPAAEDNQQFTTMSYTTQPWANYGTYGVAPALYDVAAIQYLYGANLKTRAGDDVYQLSNTETPFTKVIWDGAGSDTLDAGAQTRGATIDLQQGAFSSIGTNGAGGAAVNNVSIAYGASIGNANGGSGDDTITGNALANRLNGGAGNDTLVGLTGNDTFDGGPGSDVMDGGEGSDTSLWSGPRNAYGISLNANADDTVADSSGTDRIVGNSIEHFVFADGEYVTDTASTAAQIYRLYGATLGREPDAGGLKGWVGAIDSGSLTLNQAVAGFTGSPEFTGRYGNLEDAGFVTLLYRNVLGREPDAPGVQTWTTALGGGESRSDVVLDFSESAENINRTSPGVEQGLWLRDDTAAQVARLYHTTLDRLPDAEGLVTWTNALRSGDTLLGISDDFTNSPEFIARYGTLDNAGFTTLLYNNVLGRQPDSSGLAAWTESIDSGRPRAEVVIGFSESAEHQSRRAPYIDDGIMLDGQAQAGQVQTAGLPSSAAAPGDWLFGA